MNLLYAILAFFAVVLVGIALDFAAWCRERREARRLVKGGK
jgi:hypothetical protein